MPRFSTSRNNFLGGELSGRADGRAELPQYQQGAKQLQNFIVMQDGGVTKRPGTRGMMDLGDGLNRKFRLLPFIVDQETHAVLVFETTTTGANLLLRHGTTSFFGNTTGVIAPPLGTAAPDPWLNYLDGFQYVQTGDTMIICAAGMRPIVARRAFGYGGAGVNEPGYIIQLNRYVDGAQSLSSNPEYVRVPYRDENLDAANTLALSGTTVGSTVNITATGKSLPFNCVGSYFRFGPANNPGYFQVLTAPSNGDGYSLTGTAKILKAPASGAATANWAESAWSNLRGWPASVALYNQRLCFGGTRSEPNTIWMSQIGDIFEMYSAESTAINAAMKYTLSDSRSDTIRWMVGGKKLVIGTAGGETVGMVQEDGTNLAVSFSQETAHGSAYIQPQRVGSGIPFVQAAGKKVREIVFDFNSDAYVANDLNLLKNDLAEGYWNANLDENKLKQIAYQESPSPVLWAIDDAGTLYGVTRDRQQQVASWHTHLIGGSISEQALTGLSGPDHQAMVLAIAVTPDEQKAGDRLWMVVRREVNGVVTNRLEYMDRYRFLDRLSFAGTNQDKWFYFMDGCVSSFTATPKLRIKLTPPNSQIPLTFKDGEVLDLMVDGKYAGKTTVQFLDDPTEGAGYFVTSPIEGRAFVVGYRYTSRLKTLRTEGGSNVGVSQGSIRRVDRVFLNVHKTRFFKFGFERNFTLRQEVLGRNLAKQTDVYDQFLEPHRYTDPTEPPGSDFFTESGIVSRPAPDANGDKAIAIVLSDEPYPCTVLAITMRAVQSDV